MWNQHPHEWFKDPCTAREELTKAGAYEQVKGQVAAVLDAVRDVRPRLPELRLSLARPAVCLGPARRTRLQ